LGPALFFVFGLCTAGVSAGSFERNFLRVCKFAPGVDHGKERSIRIGNPGVILPLPGMCS
jgi:hypothetical protein